MKVEKSLLTHVKQTLESTPHYSYPQHTILSEEEFLQDINIGSSENLEIKTSVEELNFSQVGEYPILVTLFDSHTKEHSVQVLFLNIYPSKKKYAILKNTYWRAYGLVFEGKLRYMDKNITYKNDIIYCAELVSLNKQYSEKKVLPLQEKILSPLQDKFHFVLENQDIIKLEEGKYRFQIRTRESQSSITHVSRIIEKEDFRFFSTDRLEHSLVEQLEIRTFQNKEIEIYISKTGELRIKVSYSENNEAFQGNYKL